MKFSMTTLLLPALCLLAVCSTNSNAATVAYTLDPGHTQVQFNWTHLGFSHPGANFDDVSGTLLWDADDISKSSVKVDIKAASLHTHVEALDQHLKTAEFFEVAKFPGIAFTSTKVESAGSADKFKVIGELNVHGITKPVTLDVTLNKTGVYPYLEVPAFGFDASTTIKRSEFGVGGGIPMVSDEIPVRITVEALEAVGYARAMKAMAEKKK